MKRETLGLFKLLLFSMICSMGFGQIKGKIKDKLGEPLPFVNVYIEGTTIGTTSNVKGEFELDNLQIDKTYLVVFKHLGFKTFTKRVDLTLPVDLDVVLEAHSFELNEVVLSENQDPANQIIKSAIKNKDKNALKAKQYEVDFYSKGLIRMNMDDLPDFLTVEINDQKVNKHPSDSIDASVIYLSETISKVKFAKPNKFNEHIIASKVSGNDNGFSFNTAKGSDFDCYSNFITIDKSIPSPLSDHAFSHYRFKFEGSTFDKGIEINKIKIIPKRKNEPLFNGYIYIVEGSWAIYGVELKINGSRLSNPILTTLVIKQNYGYSSEYQMWIKNVQSIDFTLNVLSIESSGYFLHHFSNYHLSDRVNSSDFSKEIIRFDDNANKKDSLYWNQNRKIALTKEEVNDYRVRDSISKVKNTSVYKDSIRKVSNKFKILDLVSGYRYRLKNQLELYYDGLSGGFNTVQGYYYQLRFGTEKTNKTKGAKSNLFTEFNYGFSDHKFRPVIGFSHQFNQINRAKLKFQTGIRVQQFNSDKPISELLNSIYSLFLRENYLKIYQKKFVKGNYSQEVFNGLYFNSEFEYALRTPLFNTTDTSITKRDRDYLSNNPLLTDNFVLASFDEHQIFKSSVGFDLFFNQRYMTVGNKKVVIKDQRYPKIGVNFIKAFSPSNKQYEFDHLSLNLAKVFSFQNKGELSFYNKIGTFFRTDSSIAFMDYNHFNGNQTHINIGKSYVNFFKMLPYYELSTIANYMETHIEHNFKGFILNKIPLINKLKFELSLGYHLISQEQAKPYSEFNIGINRIGIGKFRFLRFDNLVLIVVIVQ